MPVCPSCKRAVATPGRFCPECGAALTTPGGATLYSPDTPPSSRPSSSSVIAWGIMAVLLGYGFMVAVGGWSLFSDPLSDPVATAARARK